MDKVTTHKNNIIRTFSSTSTQNRRICFGFFNCVKNLEDVKYEIPDISQIAAEPNHRRRGIFGDIS